MVSMRTNPEIQSLVQDFADQLSAVIRRAAVEEVQAKITLAIGDIAPARRGPGRPRGTRTGKRGRPGKFSPEQIESMGSTIVGHLKKNPGARSEQLGAVMKMDAKTLRIPLAALIKAKKIKVKGQKRGTQYFAR